MWLGAVYAPTKESNAPVLLMAQVLSKDGIVVFMLLVFVATVPFTGLGIASFDSTQTLSFFLEHDPPIML